MYCSKCGTSLPQGSAFCQACGTTTGTAAQRSAVFAGFWLRFVAYIIDHFVVGIPVAIIVVLLVLLTGAGVLLHHQGFPGRDNLVPWLPLWMIGIFPLIFCVAVLGGWLYYALMESSSWQGTLGKRALGLVVTDLGGARVTFGRASGRFFARIITALIPLFIGYILAGFTEKKQALHHMIAGCLVIRRA
jgi:uncharacterized RDD family membrane protein YckC